MISFTSIRARAEKRKGGPKGLAKLLPAKPDAKALAKLGDDRILAEMTKRVFSAGFAWSVIENKWPDFEKAFFGFKPAKLTFQPDEFWDGLLSDKRIVPVDMAPPGPNPRPPLFLESLLILFSSISFSISIYYAVQIHRAPREVELDSH